MYYLDENNIPQKVPRINLEFATKVESQMGGGPDVHKREVGQDLLMINNIKYRISTVFLFIQHDKDFYETMIFKGDGDEGSLGEDVYMDRYETLEEALQGHRLAITKVLTGEIS